LNGPPAAPDSRFGGRISCPDVDAVGYALTQLFVTANADEKVTNQFRIGLYPFIQNLYAYSGLTSSINGSPSTPGIINYAAANLPSQLDTNMNSSLGSGGTHIDNVLNSKPRISPIEVLAGRLVLPNLMQHRRDVGAELLRIFAHRKVTELFHDGDVRTGNAARRA
jgi:hypothetical protein